MSLRDQAAALRAQIAEASADVSALQGRIAEWVATLADVEAQIAALKPTTLPVIVYDRGFGASRDEWSTHLGLRWRNRMGDWRDANGAPQGAAPFASARVATLGPVELDVTRIVQSGSPVLLRVSGASSPATSFGGRGSATPPRIVALAADGTPVDVQVLAFASWNASVSASPNSWITAAVSTIANAAVSYRASAPIVSAKLVVTAVNRIYGQPVLNAYQLDVEPPIVAGGDMPPEMGLARDGEDALSGHPDTILACDFSDMGRFSFVGGPVPPEYLPDPDDAGRVLVRGKFIPTLNGSFGFSRDVSSVDLSDPRRPIGPGAPQELYCRMYLLVEDDWADVWQDGQKSGIGWDQRWGFHTDSGYWQQTTGNGGLPGTGLKVLRPASWQNKTERWEYQGHSQRMELGTGLADPEHPYRMFRPLVMYTYHLDQSGLFGSMIRFGNNVVPIGQWVCIETQVKTNSIVGPFDGNGNGAAVRDGVMALWIDGVLAGSRTDLAWRRHPEMGIEGPWVNFYYGGKTLPPHDMHYQIRDFALAHKYIGPKAQSYD